MFFLYRLIAISTFVKTDNCDHQFVAIIFLYYQIFLHRHSWLFHHHQPLKNYYYHHYNVTAGNDNNGKERRLGREAEPIRR